MLPILQKATELRRNYPRALASAAIVSIGLVVRLAVFRDWSAHAFFRHPAPGLDFDIHWEQARQILEGIPHPSLEMRASSAPFATYASALFRWLFGDSVLATRLASTVMGSFTPLLVFFAAIRTGVSLRAALVGALAFSLTPTLVASDELLAKTTHEIPILLAALLLLFSASRPSARSRVSLLACGLLLGAAQLSQKTALLFAVPFAAFLWLSYGTQPREKARACAVFFAGWIAIVALGKMARAADAYGYFPPLSGVHIRIGWNPGALGTYSRLPAVVPNAVGHAYDARLMAEAEVGHPLSAHEVDKFHRDKAIRAIVADPLTALRLLAQKILLFFNDEEMRSDEHLAFLAENSRTFSWLPMSWGIWLLLAGMGTWRLVELRTWPLLVLLSGSTLVVLASNCVAFVTWRYRLPAIVPLSLLATFAIDAFPAWWRQTREARSAPRIRTLKRVSLASVALTSLAVLAFRPVTSESVRESMLHKSRSNANRSNEAEEMSARLQTDSTPATPAAAASRFLALARLHRHTEAYRYAREVPALTLDNVPAAAKWVRYLLWYGNYDEAATFLRRVRAERPQWGSTVITRADTPTQMALSRLVLPNLTPEKPTRDTAGF